MQKDLNLFAAGRSGAGGEQSERLILIGGVATPVALLLIFAGLTIGLRVLSGITREQTAQINTFLSGTQVATAHAGLQNAQEKISLLGQYASAASKAVSELDALPRLDSSVISEIQAAMPAGVTATTFSYTSGVISLNCTAADALAPAHFSENLTNSGHFANVSYSGYSASGSSVTFSITFSLKGGAAQ